MKQIADQPTTGISRRELLGSALGAFVAITSASTKVPVQSVESTSSNLQMNEVTDNMVDVTPSNLRMSQVIDKIHAYAKNSQVNIPVQDNVTITVVSANPDSKKKKDGTPAEIMEMFDTPNAPKFTEEMGFIQEQENTLYDGEGIRATSEYLQRLGIPASQNIVDLEIFQVYVSPDRDQLKIAGDVSYDVNKSRPHLIKYVNPPESKIPKLIKITGLKGLVNHEGKDLTSRILIEADMSITVYHPEKGWIPLYEVIKDNDNALLTKINNGETLLLLQPDNTFNAMQLAWKSIDNKDSEA